MSQFVLYNQRLILGHVNVTGMTNAMNLSREAEALDNTVFQQNTRSFMPGLYRTTLGFSGFLETESPYIYALSTQEAIVNTPISIIDGATVGNYCYFAGAYVSNIQPLGGAVGELIQWSAAAELSRSSSSPPNLTRGRLMYWTESFSTSANGTAIQLGAATTTQRVWGAVHVVNAPNSTTSQLSVTATFQNAASSGFTGATTSLNLGAFGAAGSKILSCTGNITNTWWRFSHATVTSSQSTSFGIIAVLGLD